MKKITYITLGLLITGIALLCISSFASALGDHESGTGVVDGWIESDLSIPSTTSVTSGTLYYVIGKDTGFWDTRNQTFNTSNMTYLYSIRINANDTPHWAFGVTLYDNNTGAQVGYDTLHTTEYDNWYEAIYDMAITSNHTYKIKIEFVLAGVGTMELYYDDSNPYPNGECNESALHDINFQLIDTEERYTLKDNTTFRNITGISEFNVFNYTDNNFSHNGSVIIKIPVSTSFATVTSVSNCSNWSETWTSVSSLGSVVAGTYYFDSANHYVYVGRTNITLGEHVNISVNGSQVSAFTFLLPEYKKVGEDIILSGYVTRYDGSVAAGEIIYAYIYHANNTVAIGPNKWNCTAEGNFYSILPTTSLIPGVYIISINFTDPDSGYEMKKSGTLYLSTSPVAGVYSDATVTYNFYNTNEG